MLAWKRGFCRNNADSNVLPERGSPEMKWYLEVIRGFRTRWGPLWWRAYGAFGRVAVVSRVNFNKQ